MTEKLHSHLPDAESGAEHHSEPPSTRSFRVVWGEGKQVLFWVLRGIQGPYGMAVNKSRPVVWPILMHSYTVGSREGGDRGGDIKSRWCLPFFWLHHHSLFHCLGGNICLSVYLSVSVGVYVCTYIWEVFHEGRETNDVGERMKGPSSLKWATLYVHGFVQCVCVCV